MKLSLNKQKPGTLASGNFIISSCASLLDSNRPKILKFIFCKIFNFKINYKNKIYTKLLELIVFDEIKKIIFNLGVF